MIDESTVYWITRLDNIRIFVIALLCLTGVLFFLSFFLGLVVGSGKAVSDAEKEEKKKDEKCCATVFLISVAALFILGIVLVFVPTTKEMCAIKVIPAVANCEQVQSLGSDVVDLARGWMDELKPETVKSREAKK